MTMVIKKVEHPFNSCEQAICSAGFLVYRKKNESEDDFTEPVR